MHQILRVILQPPHYSRYENDLAKVYQQKSLIKILIPFHGNQLRSASVVGAVKVFFQLSFHVPLIALVIS